jgi:pyruvate formate-lyase activating enzyme-like uncharacterized protein
MTIQYSIAKKDSIQVIGHNGEGRIKYNITGFNNEYLEVVVRRKEGYYSTADGKIEWEIDIDIPRYGRDKDAEPSNIEVFKNIRACMAEAIVEMTELETMIPEMERNFQIGEKQRKAKREAEEAARQAKIDADKAVGVKLAKTICDNMVKQARDTKQDSKEITFKTRGEHRDIQMRCIYTDTGLTLFNSGYYRISRKDAVKQLADAWLNSVDTGDIKDDIPDARLANFMLGGSAK